MLKKRKQLKPVPYIGSDEPKDQQRWLAKAIRAEPYPDQQKILKYLRGCHCMAAVPLIQRDPLADNALIRDRPYIITDGVWVWVGSVAHFVEQHNVELPEEFVEHMRANNHTPIKKSQVKFSDIAPTLQTQRKFFFPADLGG